MTQLEGIPWIEQGIRDFRATGSVFGLPFWLALKAEALHLADRTSEALEAINEAEAVAERFEHGDCFAELHRLRGVFLAAMGADETQIEASFCAAIRIAKEQKSISLEKRAEATYARIPPPKSERVRRTWIPTTSLIISCASVRANPPSASCSFASVKPSTYLRLGEHFIVRT